ncbi:MAG: SDR family oxidoreductase [Betaproteobacteria bacterium]|nr:SDR family oxidoreductase [Betaproteobacteria bacterium]
MRGDRFTDKVAVVTGAASGIGAAAARAFAAEGAKLALLDSNQEGLREMAKEIAGSGYFVVDVASGASIKAAFDAVLQAFGTVHVLVNSAGVIGKWTLQNMTEVEWDRVLDINLKGTALCTQAVIAPMRARGGGAVVNVSSMAGKRVSYAGAANYTASKTGVVGFTWHAAFELAAYKIRVNAVCPGPTITGMTRKRTPEQLAATAARIPLGRWVLPEDVANAILFLASDEAAMCTGTALDVDGGILVSNGSSYEEYFASRT